MKKKLVLLLVGTGMLTGIVGCGSTSSSNTSSSEPISYPPIELGYEAQDVVDMITKIVSDGNYTLEYDYNDVTYKEYYTKDYGYYEATGQGYIGLPDYSDSTKELFYKFTLSNENLRLYQTLTYRDDNGVYQPVRTTEHLDYMKLLADDEANFAADDFTIHQTGFYTNNEDLILTLANLMGYADSVNLISLITFTKIDDTTLKFKFSPNFNEGYEIIDGVTGTFTNIGVTEYEFLENYLDTYQLPANVISEEAANTLSADIVSVNTNVTRWFSNSPIEQIQRSEIDFSEDAVYLKSYYRDLEDPVYNRYVKGQDNNAYLTYVNTSNKVVSVNTGKNFSEMFPSLNKYFERLAFRNSGQDNVYNYYGYNARWLIKALSTYDLGVTESVDVTVTNGKITHIIAKTPIYTNSYGERYYTQVELTIETQRSIPQVSALTPSSNDAEIQTILSLFNGETSFKGTIVTDNNTTHTTIVTVDNGIMLYEVNGYDTDLGASEAMIKYYYGYEVSSQGAIPFGVTLNEDDDGNVTGVAKANDATLVNATMADVIGFTASSEIFDKNSSGQIVVRDSVSDLGQGVFAGTYADYIVPSSLELVLDADNYPLSLSYSYEMDTGYYVGEEEIIFSEWTVASLPENIDFSDIGVWKAPTNWQEELTEEQYTELVTTFGEGYPETIPYIYARELSGSWQINNSSAEIDNVAYLHLFSVDVDTPYGVSVDFYENYATTYADMLVNQGFEEVVLAQWGGLAVYKKGDVHIRITYNEGQVDLFIIKNFLAEDLVMNKTYTGTMSSSTTNYNVSLEFVGYNMIKFSVYENNNLVLGGESSQSRVHDQYFSIVGNKLTIKFFEDSSTNKLSTLTFIISKDLKTFTIDDGMVTANQYPWTSLVLTLSN